MSLAYEGTVHVTVSEDWRGADRVLGKGFVNGGAETPRPLQRPDFVQPPHRRRRLGRVHPRTQADLGIFSATAVRVRFVNSDHKPQILGVVTDPRPASPASS